MSELKNSEIKFGTDGWRAVISEGFTFKNVIIVGQAISEWIHRDLKGSLGKTKTVAIGYDTRFLSNEYAQTVACVLAANGLDVLLSDSAIPTPALSFGVVQTKSCAGIMITASHNPGRFNGIKIKTAQGGAAPKDVTNKIESYLYKTDVKKFSYQEAQQLKKILHHDFKKDYIKFIRQYLDLKKIKSTKFKVITDAMHGSGNGLMADILKGTKIRLSLMREDVNPSFEGGKPEPVVEYLGKLLKRVKQEKFDLGLVLDGDADRIGAVASGGEFVHPQKILGLLILHLVRHRKVSGAVVKTICGTTMIDRIASRLNLKLYETPVGFKYISDLMVSEKIVAGGEEAGGMGLPNYIPERDGSLAGLLLLEMMVYEKKNLKKIVEAMEKEFGRYFYQRLDYDLGLKAFSLNQTKSINALLGRKVIAIKTFASDATLSSVKEKLSAHITWESPKSFIALTFTPGDEAFKMLDVKNFDGIKFIADDENWLMFRTSGTEPLVRIYAEAKSLKKAKDLIELGRQLIAS